MRDSLSRPVQIPAPSDDRRQSFSRLEAEGIVVALQPGAGRRASVYDGFAVVHGFMKFRERQLTGGHESARDRRDNSVARLNQLKLERESGVLLRRETVLRESIAFIAATRAKLLGIPRRMVNAALVAPSAEQATAELIRECLTEISRWKTMTDLLAAAGRDNGEEPAR